MWLWQIDAGEREGERRVYVCFKFDSQGKILRFVIINNAGKSESFDYSANSFKSTFFMFEHKFSDFVWQLYTTVYMFRSFNQRSLFLYNVIWVFTNKQQWLGAAFLCCLSSMWITSILEHTVYRLVLLQADVCNYNPRSKYVGSCNKTFPNPASKKMPYKNTIVATILCTIPYNNLLPYQS